jgi:hypothetical protein
MKKERSRAYPLVDLETAFDILRRQLGPWGEEALDRHDLAARLGYSTGDGGKAARKIAALVHYGLLDRSGGQYRLSRLGRRILDLPPGSAETQSALRTALERPALFRSVLALYQPEWRSPGNLARALATEFGITVRASFDAAEAFLRSAHFAGALADDGRRLDALQPSPASEQERPGDASAQRSGAESKRIELLLSDRKSAWLEIPTGMDRKDVKMLAQALEDVLPRVSAHLGLDDGAEVRPFRRRSTSLRLTNSDESPEG